MQTVPHNVSGVSSQPYQQQHQQPSPILINLTPLPLPRVPLYQSPSAKRRRLNTSTPDESESNSNGQPGSEDDFVQWQITVLPTYSTLDGQPPIGARYVMLKFTKFFAEEVYLDHEMMISSSCGQVPQSGVLSCTLKFCVCENTLEEHASKRSRCSNEYFTRVGRSQANPGITLRLCPYNYVGTKHLIPGQYSAWEVNAIDAALRMFSATLGFSKGKGPRSMLIYQDSI